MSHQYRVVHFRPDPALDGRIPVAALVLTETGVRVARAARIPGPDCLGGREIAEVLSMFLDGLLATSSIDELPSSVGPYGCLSAARAVPAGVQDPVSWLTSNVLPRRETDSRVPHVYRGPRRATHGFRFLQTWRVSECVERRLPPSEVWHQPSQRASRLPAVNHWVRGRSQVLLMEPLLPQRDDFEREVNTVQGTFAVYHIVRQALTQAGPEPVFISYLLGGDGASARDRVRAALEVVDARVYDTERLVERDALLDLIRGVRGTADRQLL